MASVRDGYGYDFELPDDSSDSDEMEGYKDLGSVDKSYIDVKGTFSISVEFMDDVHATDLRGAKNRIDEFTETLGELFESMVSDVCNSSISPIDCKIHLDNKLRLIKALKEYQIDALSPDKY